MCICIWLPGIPNSQLDISLLVGYEGIRGVCGKILNDVIGSVGIAITLGDVLGKECKGAVSVERIAYGIVRSLGGIEDGRLLSGSDVLDDEIPAWVEE
jgi:hypothetical protein